MGDILREQKGPGEPPHPLPNSAGSPSGQQCGTPRAQHGPAAPSLGRHLPAPQQQRARSCPSREDEIECCQIITMRVNSHSFFPRKTDLFIK